MNVTGCADLIALHTASASVESVHALLASRAPTVPSQSRLTQPRVSTIAPVMVYVAVAGPLALEAIALSSLDFSIHFLSWHSRTIFIIVLRSLYLLLLAPSLVTVCA